jgi:TonB family protein
MIVPKRAIEFDCASSDGLPVELTALFRRKAFSIRRENGMPRAVALSLLVHAVVGAMLLFQLVPPQFIRMQGSENVPETLEVFLIAEPAGGAPQPAQAVVAAPAAVPEPVVKAVKKPESIKKEPAEYSLHRKMEAVPAPVPVQAGKEAGAADATAGSLQPAQDASAQGPGGPAGAGGGSGSGAAYETNFGQADAPRFLQYVQPKYPLAARQQGREGTVVLRLTIDESGNLVQVEVLASPSDGFAESAVEAVKRSTFAAAQRGGKAVASRAVLPVRFALKR